MPSGSPLLLISYVVLGCAGGFFYLYGTYLSFSIRKALAVPLYRSRALWNGFIGLLVLVFSTTYLLGQFNTAPYLSVLLAVLLYFLILPVLFLVGFAWIDRTMSVLIRLDILQRDILGWRHMKFRFFYWALFAVQLAFFYWFSFGATFTTPILILEYLWFVFFAALLVYSSVGIVIGSSRCRDATFRVHIMWLGYYVATGLIVSVVSFVFSLLTGTLVEPFLGPILGAYFFFRMARSLAPLNRTST